MARQSPRGTHVDVLEEDEEVARVRVPISQLCVEELRQLAHLLLCRRRDLRLHDPLRLVATHPLVHLCAQPDALAPLALLDRLDRIQRARSAQLALRLRAQPLQPLPRLLFRMDGS